jgi:hypothetical protein
MKYLFIIFLSFSIAIYLVREDNESSVEISTSFPLADTLSVNNNAALSFIRFGAWSPERLNTTTLASDIEAVCVSKINHIVSNVREYAENRHNYTPSK